MIVLDKKDIQNSLTMSKCIELMKELFSFDPQESLINPLRSKLPMPENGGVLGAMPVFIKPYEIMGMKIISVFPNNYKYGLSSHQGKILLFESKYGKQLALLDADEITAIRTAAVSALATALLSRKNSTRLCLLGSGVQASKHLEAIAKIRDIKNVRVWSPNPVRLNSFVEKHSEKFSPPIKACNSAQKAVRNADIICTVSSSAKPILKNKWVAPGTHINAVGACTPETREIDGKLVQNSLLFIDNYEATMAEAGNIVIPIRESLIKKEHIRGDIYEVLSQKVSGRETENDVTLFSSVGIAAEDLAVAHYLYKKHREKEE